MKRTDLERRERELARSEKKKDVLSRGSKEAMTVGDYIDALFGLFRYDSEEIFNTQNDEAILELLENMKVEIPEKKWDDVIRKAVNKTKAASRERSINELKSFMGISETANAG